MMVSFLFGNRGRRGGKLVTSGKLNFRQVGCFFSKQPRAPSAWLKLVAGWPCLSSRRGPTKDKRQEVIQVRGKLGAGNPVLRMPANRVPSGLLRAANRDPPHSGKPED